MKKTFIAIGLVVLIAGLALTVVSSQEEYTEITQKDEWPLYSKTLLSQNSTFYATLMNPGMWFQLNVSAAYPVGLQVSITRLPDIKDPIFIQIDTKFDQKVQASRTGTYWIDIENGNSFPVTLDGNVLVMQPETHYNSTHPYALPGFLIMLAGIAVAVWGGFRKPKEGARSRRVTTTQRLHTSTKPLSRF